MKTTDQQKSNSKENFQRNTIAQNSEAAAGFEIAQ